MHKYIINTKKKLVEEEEENIKKLGFISKIY